MFGKKGEKDKKDKDKKDKDKDKDKDNKKAGKDSVAGAGKATSSNNLLGNTANSPVAQQARPEEPVPPDCVAVFTNRSTYLGDLLAWDRKRDPSLKVPLIVRLTLDHMFDIGLNTEGLFRVPGNSTKMATVEDEFNRGRGTQVDFKRRVSCEDSASLLKKFLRDSLPEELFTARLSDAFKQLVEVSDRASRKSQFLALWQQLPPENRAVAFELLQFLVQVAANADLNKMNSENLGTVFGEMARVPIQDGKHLLKWLIDDWQFVFELDQLAGATEITFLRKLIGHYKSVIGMNQCGNFILSTDSGGAVNVWETTEYCSKKRMKAEKRCYIAPLVVNAPNGNQQLWAFFPDACRVYDASSLQLENAALTAIADNAATTTIAAPNICAATLVNNSMVWTVGEKIEIFDAFTHAKVRDATDYPAGQDVTSAVGFACGYVWTWRNKIFSAWDPSSMTKVRDITDSSGKPTRFFEIGGLVWVGTESGAIVILDPVAFTVRTTLKQHNATVYCAVPVGPLVWTCSWDKSICAWDPQNLAFVAKVPNKHTDAISWILPVWKPSYNGWECWTGSWDRSVQIYFVPVNYAAAWGFSSAPASPAPVPYLQVPTPAEAQPTQVSPRSLPRAPSQAGPGAALASVMFAGGVAPKRPVPAQPVPPTQGLPPAPTTASPNAGHHHHGSGHARKKSNNTADAGMALPTPAAGVAPKMGPLISAPLPPPLAAPATLPPPIAQPPQSTTPPPMAIPPPLTTFYSTADPSAIQALESEMAQTDQSRAELAVQIDQAVQSVIAAGADVGTSTYWRSILEDLHQKETALVIKYTDLLTQLVELRQALRNSYLPPL